MKKYTFKRIEVNNLDDFRNDIIKCLGDEIFECNTLDQLVYKSLKVIHPVYKNLKNEDQSLQNKSLKVLEHFGFNRTGKIHVSVRGENGERILLNEENRLLSPKQKFLNQIIRFKQVPKAHLEYLVGNSEYHLKKMTQLVNRYFETPFIAKMFWKEEKVPSNQNERMLLDYYKRCLSEQQFILSYRFGEKIKERAIVKATKMPINLPMNLFDFFDFPYYSSKTYSEGYFDHEKIDTVYHRLVETTVHEEDENLTKLYFRNKRIFYSKLFKEYHSSQYFKDIKYYSQILPLSNTRKNVLNELEFLFQKKKWVSFYGIALSQIEGLFLEMTNVVGTKGKRSMYHKINEIKDSDSTGNLDYYQYYIPQLRNKFMHGALDGEEGIKENSFDLLTDIRYLLMIFHELDNPLVKLKRILSNSNYTFSTIEEITSFFQILSDKNESLRGFVKTHAHEIKKFLKEKLVENKNLEVIVSNLQNEVKDAIEITIRFLDTIFLEKGLNFGFSNSHTIKIFFDNENNRKLLQKEYFILGNTFNELSIYNIFLTKYTKWIEMNDSLSFYLKNISQEYKADLQKLIVISRLVED
ncbi:hypothetical protein [Flagellimonas algicola]|uniref:Apea-like HEPN domain-containing protein n=1 Tax=Flagellimonas algicola TaxID=2583815 RepID=A0ABY2WJA5_9FLAO|nr:hypothetical protein [Allomuricauda algicola]TMU54591.1 hypothetical protein FGG15_10275 [Allomuricauda algicola]